MGGAKLWALVTGIMLGSIASQPSAIGAEISWRKGGDVQQSKREVKELLKQASRELGTKAGTSPALRNVDPIDSVDGYIEELVLRAESLDITGGDGHMVVRMRFDRDRVRFDIAGRDQRSWGQIYAIDLDREISFEVFSNNGIVHVAQIRGFTFYVKLPLISEAVHIMQLAFDVEAQRASIYASAAYDVVRLVAHANVRFRRFDGIEWFSPLLGSLPELFEGARFRPSNPVEGGNPLPGFGVM